MRKKRFIKFIMKILICIMLVCCGIMKWSYMVGRQFYRMEQEDTFNVLEEPNGLIIKWQDGVPKEQKDKTVGKFKRLPQNVQDKFIEDGWEIYLIEDTIYSYNSEVEEGTIALITFDSKKIFFSIRSNSIDKAFFHEFGHFIDSMGQQFDHKFMSNKEEFVKAMDKELKNMRYKPAKKDSKEFFAEVYSISMERPEEAEKNYPKTLKLIRGRIKEYK
ncbi:MAG: hypothetical protein Q4G05_01515 [Clostridia bacterium]|nr:hypothetical protein [Clostridia bacterium]